MSKTVSKEDLEDWQIFVSTIRYNVLSDIVSLKNKNITNEDISELSSSVAKLEEVFEKIVNKITIEKAPATKDEIINDLKNKVKE